MSDDHTPRPDGIYCDGACPALVLRQWCDVTNAVTLPGVPCVVVARANAEALTNLRRAAEVVSDAYTARVHHPGDHTRAALALAMRSLRSTGDDS